MSPYVLIIKSLLHAIRENIDLGYQVIQAESYYKIRLKESYYTVRLNRDQGVVFIHNSNPRTIESLEDPELYEEFKETVENFII